ncbi:MAG: hypothetical protein HY935_02575 [Nitrosomonadales bacterium]|nr:hypothetical protein [Nitrosomonadales bacterium]
MKTIIAAIVLALLAACQSTPRLEEDTRYVKLATVVDIHEFTEIERKQARANRPGDSSVGFGIGVGTGTYGSFGGVTLGMGHRVGSSDEPPQIAKGANRITVQPLGSTERIEVMSYGKHKAGDCVKVLAGHPTEFPRFFALKPDERCE